MDKEQLALIMLLYSSNFIEQFFLNNSKAFFQGSVESIRGDYYCLGISFS